MAWQRDEANLGISGATAYSYTEVDWEVQGDRCTYRHIGGVTSPYNFSATATSTLQWWESGTWHDYAGPASATFGGYGDLPLVDVEDYFVRQAADRVVSLGCYTTMMGGSARAWIDYTVPHLAPSVTWASSNPVVRNSDNSITLTWNAPALEYSAMCLEVSIDGGAWSQFAVLWNTATSYEWTGCSTDHSYQFRIRTNYLSTYSAYDTCATVIYMTPAPPQSIATAAAGGTNITVNLVNPSPVATKVQYEVSTDDGATWGATQDSASLTSFSVSASGTVKIRVRNYNATGTSAWLTSETVTTICPPARPTITSPQTGAWDVSQPLSVAWLHNSLDGSAQEAYKLRVTKMVPPLASHTETYSPSTASTQSVTWANVQGWLPTLALGDSMAVGIATKGADASYSSFGTSAGIVPFTAPTLSITSPSATVTGMPIQIEAAYSDMAGFTCQAATVTLKSGDRTILTKPATISGTSLTCDISLSDALLDNGAEYTIVLDVRSSSGLQATANATFTTAFTEPQAGELSIANDPDTGYASLLATFDNHASDVEYSGATNEQFDTTAGYVRSLTVQGKSEKWNQLYTLASGSGSGTNYSFTVSNGKVTLTTTATATTSGNNDLSFGSTFFTAGHKYLFLCSGDSRIALWLKSYRVMSGNILSVETASYNNCAFVFTDLPTGTYNFYPQFIDLTAIYGAGNEPTALTDPRIAWLKAYALAHPDYDAGSLVSIEGVSVGDGTITTTIRSLPQGKGDELRVDGTSASKFDRTYYDTISAVGTVNTSGSTWYAGLTTTNQATLRRNWTSVDDFNSDRGTTGTEFAYCTKTTKISATGKGIFVARTWNGLYAYCTAADAQELGITTSDFAALVGAGVIARNKTATDTLPDISLIEIGSAFTILTDLDSTFAMTTWDGSADAVSISVSRVNSDGITPLIEDGESGAGAVDKYAPLNTPYQYAVTTKSSANAVKTVYVDNEIITDLWFAYWGDNIASAKWNPDNGGIAIARPQKTRVYYAGRKDPVSYDGAAVSLTETPSWMVVDRSEIQPFVQLIEDGGRGVYKSCDGWVYHADFDLTLTPKYTAIGYYGGVGLSVTRIAGDAL